MDEDDSEKIAVNENDIEYIKKKVDRIDKAVYGNGRFGLKTRHHIVEVLVLALLISVFGTQALPLLPI